tara:strand:- start:4583 stop:5164 length:582 start_codon:yes stop_codon:yes gene_type:complete
MNIVVAACKNRGIGFKNKLPWNLSKEIKYFKELTIGEKNNGVVMGRNTWNSIPEKNRPLPKRQNIVLTSRVENMFFKNKGNGVSFAPSLKSVEHVYGPYTFDNIWIIGGERLYSEALKDNLIDSIFYTEILSEYECDTFFPKIPNNFSNIYESQIIYDCNEEIKFKVYKRDGSNITSNKLRSMCLRAEKKALV